MNELINKIKQDRNLIEGSTDLDQFERLANQIFEQKTKQFSHVNQQSMRQVVQPLQAKLDEFKHQISQQSRQEGLEHALIDTNMSGNTTLIGTNNTGEDR